MTFFKWSRTASSNSNADSTINWAEGQAPSSVNDSARAVMAAASKYRDDISGAITTGGTSTAYTVSSYQSFDSLANMNGAMIAFTPHATNGATVTLNVDGLGAKPLRWATGVELQSNTLILGTPYVATYNNGNSEWILQGFSNPYGIPLGAGIDYWGTTAPSSAYVFPYGQAISRSTYSTLFSLFSTTYGSGDGSTTFNVPDLRGRVTAKKDDMGGSSANRLTDADDGLDGDTLGDAGGGETQVIQTTNLPSQTPAGTVSGTFSGSGTLSGSITGGGGATGGSFAPWLNSGSTNVNVSGSISASFTGTPFAGQNSTAMGIVQPTIICNYILRVI